MKKLIAGAPVFAILTFFTVEAIRAEPPHDALPAGPSQGGTAQMSASCQQVVLESIRRGYIAHGANTGSPKDILRTKCGFCHDSSQPQGMKEWMPGSHGHIKNGREAFDISKDFPFQGGYARDLKGQSALLTSLKAHIEKGKMPPASFRELHSIETFLKPWKSSYLALGFAMSVSEGAYVLPGSTLAQAQVQQQMDAQKELTAEMNRVYGQVLLSDDEKKTIFAWVDQTRNSVKNPPCRDSTTTEQASTPKTTAAAKTEAAKKPLARAEAKQATEKWGTTAKPDPTAKRETISADRNPTPLTGATLADATQNMIKNTCFDCHGPQTHLKNHRVDLSDITKLSDKTLEDMLHRMKGGPNGQTPDGLDAMPLGEDGAKPEQIKLLSDWIKNGKPRTSNP